jgi:transcriptional regulator with XRE-family HTH domain
MQQPSFAVQLRGWRRRREWSQLELSGRAGISQRHLAFPELERASPSRDMVARLAKSLDLPLRQQNALLLAAGFAPVWREYFIRSVEADAVVDVTEATVNLLERLRSYRGARSVLKEHTVQERTALILPMQFHKDAVTLNLFTTITTLGTPRNITLQELRIERFYRWTTRLLRSCGAGRASD